MQDRTTDGQRILNALIRINPQVLEGHPCQVTEYFVNNSCADEKDDHSVVLRHLFNQLPELPVDISDHLSWTIQQGYLIKGVRTALWGRGEDSRNHFQRAVDSGSTFSEWYLQKVAQHIINFEIEMSGDDVQTALQRLLPQIQRLSRPDHYRKFLSALSAKRAFENYQRRHYYRVPGNVLQAMRNDPRFITNRGMISILTRSFFKR
jgi:hypothetical protein